MEYAGWQEGRKVDISIAEKYYADHGVPMMKTTQRFYRKYFGLCCEWYLEQKKLNWAADFQFALFPYLVNGIKNHLEEAYFRDMSGCELAEVEQAAGEKCQPMLPAQDMELIQALYFECLTEREYAQRIGISQKGVNKRRQKVLDKLRAMMKAK